MDFIALQGNDTEGILAMSRMATEIVREHFDPIIGTAQNDYMLARFQSVEAISAQLSDGYRYFFVREQGRNIGFLAFYPRDGYMYLSKFYLYGSERGNGYARAMLNFTADAARADGLTSIRLNVNRNNPVCAIYEKLGFTILREEKNDIGQGFFMDDYVYSLAL